MGRERGARRKAGLALITALALVVSGIPATTASAAGPQLLAGQILLPAGHEPAGVMYTLHLYRDDGGNGPGPYQKSLSFSEGHVIAGIIPFSFTGLEGDAQYRIELRDSRAELTAGFYVADDTGLTSRPSSAGLVSPGRTDLRIRPEEGAEITGRVELPQVDGNFWPDGVVVRARNLDLAGSLTSTRLIPPDSGNPAIFSFTLGGLVSGDEYFVELFDGAGFYQRGFAAGDGLPTTPDHTKADPIEAPGNVRIAAVAAGSIQGQLVTPPGVGPENFRISAMYLDAERAIWRPVSLAAEAYLEEDGGFVLRDLDPDGQYAIGVQDLSSGGGWGSGFYDGENNPLAAEPTVLIPAGTTNLQLLIAPPPMLLAHVALPAGADPYKFTLEAYAADDFEDPAVWAEPDAAGQFYLAGVTEGESYALRLSVGNTEYLPGWYAGEGMPLAASTDDAVLVTPSTTVLMLEPVTGQPIAGSLVLPEGFSWESAGSSPRILVTVHELTADGEERDSSSLILTAGDGDRFVFHGLRPGADHVLSFLSTDGQFARGYYRAPADGLVKAFEHATRVQPGTGELTVRISDTTLLPAVRNLAVPTLSGTPQVGQTLRATSGSWSEPDVTASLEWLRDGTAVPGATSSSYVLTDQDVGAQMAVRATGSKPGFADGVAESVPTGPVTLAPSPQPPQEPQEPHELKATAAPKITGKMRLGKKLRATPGEWDAAAVRVSYQWLRAGKAIKGATKRRYTIKKKDVGKRLTVRVTARAAGHHDGVSAVRTKKIKRAKPNVKVKAKNVKARKRPRVVVRLKGVGLAKPRGTVRIRYGKQTLRTKMRPKHRGKVAVRLPRLDKGRYRVVVRYVPNAKSKKHVRKAKSKRVTLRVR